MRRKKIRKSDIIDELKVKKMNPLFPVAVFLTVVTILSIIIWPIYLRVIDILDLDESDSTQIINKPSKKPSSTKDKRELLVPKIENSVHEIKNSKLIFHSIEADELGYLLTISLVANNNYSTIEINAINIDGFYIKDTFVLSDKVDYASNGERLAEQKATTIEFRIDTIDLTELAIFGFNKMNFYYDYEENGEVTESLYTVLTVSNSIVIVNERKGLIPIDSTNNLTISYYKTVEDNDYTYIYFDFKNKTKDKDYIIEVKSLEINGKEYKMSDFARKIYRECEHAEYIAIPKSKFSKVNSFKLSFFVSHRISDGKVNYIHYTKEYIKTY